MTRYCQTCGKKLKKNEWEDCRACAEYHAYNYPPHELESLEEEYQNLKEEEDE